MTEWLDFRQLDIPNRKTKVFEVYNKVGGEYLGDIEWDGGWRQYVFVQRTDVKIKMSWSCQIQCGEFTKKLIEEWKEAHKKNDKN